MCLGGAKIETFIPNEYLLKNEDKIPVYFLSLPSILTKTILE